MNFVSPVDMLAALAGLALAAALCMAPRFGPGSWLLSLFLVPASASAAIIVVGPLLGWPGGWSTFLSFSCLVFCGAGGCLNSYTIKRADYGALLTRRRTYFFLLTFVAPVLVVLLNLRQLLNEGFTNEPGVLALGLPGFYAAIYLLAVSIITLGNLEQAIRHAEEHVRWELKFLALGIASTFVTIIYVASTILLYSPVYAVLSTRLLRIFPVIFLFACCLIFESWRRSTAATRLVVSQGVIYSTITLVSVGAYLIVSAVVARWVSHWESTGIPAEPVVFILSLIVLSTVLLGTAFKHRVRRWIRRNVFAGRYDYRQFWMDATERVRSTDATTVAGAALVELIEKALGSLDISLWGKDRRSDSMRLIAARGTIVGQLAAEFPDMARKLAALREPVLLTGLENDIWKEAAADLVHQSKASLLVPLVSSGRVVGLLTVGADRSGKPFDWETREFLRVMGVHLANELDKAELLSGLVEAREAEVFKTFSTFLLHDLKNFASTLSLIAKNANRHHGNPDFQFDAFQSVSDISEKMKRLCNSLRSFSSSLAANKRREDINEIVRSVADTFEQNVGKPLLLDLGVLPETAVDREEILRVLHNLVLNAHEASADGSVIKLETKMRSEQIVISVADNGSGISRDFLEVMFQPFHTTKPEGMGIGLFQSKMIIEAHLGKIEVESVEFKGTTVRIVLPVERTAAPYAGVETGEPSRKNVTYKVS